MKSPTALERLAAVDTVVFAKTGTLTERELRLIDAPERDREDRLIAASLAVVSRHPLARALAAAYRLLKRGGRVAVLDLLAHQFEQAREMYADAWLGFTEADMHRMLEAAGFKDIEVQVVAREEQPPHFQTLFGSGRK